MAKARSRTIERPQSAELDDSSEHPALTPLMRRLAREYWEIVRAKAEEQGLLIVKAWVSPYWDMEDSPVVFIAVHMGCSPERAAAFHYSLNAAHDLWKSRLDTEEIEVAANLAMVPVGVAKAAVNGA